MTARNHHFVPQGYLRRFCRHRDKPRLFVADLKSRRAFHASTRDVGALRDFHAIDIEGHPPDALEAALGQFEGQVAAALDRIIAARQITDDEDRALLLNLVGLLAVKSPRHRENFRAFKESVIRKMLTIVTSKDDIWQAELRKAKEVGVDLAAHGMTREQLHDFAQRGEFKIGFAPGYHVGIELQAFDRVLPVIADRQWSLLRAPLDSQGFVTSDHPACLQWADPASSTGAYPPGLGMKETLLLFPISPGLAWLGSFEREARVVDIGEDRVQAFNATVISFAERQVYGRDGDCEYRVGPAGRVKRLRELPNDQRFWR